ncbi:hypothetical protein F0L74_09955 [Chitinophaga agrisoli]|uniref:Uncharacterized protein n=1 Tax=Chitinophaga agrisoli TaxID=2607653 RepID=A0A5B2VWZ4_9BACT|nr:hypothetical protein [Chitinophaga agrisoli]KAA2242842.1 hypothetical protein F0L74_09955 [Chitinophaga agrisoli]
MKPAITLINEERIRQAFDEGYTPAHDDQHTNGELAYAAASYARNHDALPGIKNGDYAPPKWPWKREYWKPTPDNRIRELVKAGALICAEIERLQRLEEKQNTNQTV